MCMFKSGIIMKDRVFVPDYDHHTDMLEELKIADTRSNAEKIFVRAELIPKNNDVFSPVDEWEFRVDQDIIPEWFVKSYEEQRMKEAVKEWVKDHIHIGVDNLKIDAGDKHYIKDCKNVTVCGNATVNKVCGNATVTSSPYSNWQNKTKLIISNNATFKDCYSKVIWQSGEWEIRKVVECDD